MLALGIYVYFEYLNLVSVLCEIFLFISLTVSCVQFAKVLFKTSSINGLTCIAKCTDIYHVMLVMLCLLVLSEQTYKALYPLGLCNSFVFFFCWNYAVIELICIHHVFTHTV